MIKNGYSILKFEKRIIKFHVYNLVTYKGSSSKAFQHKTNDKTAFARIFEISVELPIVSHYGILNK